MRAHAYKSETHREPSIADVVAVGGQCLTAVFVPATLGGVTEFFTNAEASAWGGFLSTHGRLTKRLEENLRRTSGLSHAEYEVLLRLVINDDGRLRIQELAAESVLTHSGTSRLVDRLVGAGLVERTEAEDDRRGAYAVITETGRSHFMEAARQHTAFVREIFLSQFSDEELAMMGSLWERLDEI